MKKYKFLFLTLLFGIFFIPKDVFASGISVYTSDYKVIGSCNNCTSITLDNAKNVGRIRFNITSQDMYKLTDYKLDIETNISTSNGNLNSNDYAFFVDGYSVSTVYLTRQSIEWVGAPAYIAKYTMGWSGKFQNDHNNADMFFEFALNSASEVYAINFNYKLINLGSDNISAIQNSTQNIISNDNINTDKIIDNQNKNQQQTNEKLDKIEDSITSEEGPDLNSLNNSAGWLPVGPVDSILNLPLSFFNNLTDNLSKSCQPVAFTFPFINTNFSLPCISTLYEQIGIQDFLNWLGLIVGCIILYYYFLNLYKWVDDTLTFRENNHADWGGV